jgi:hypothetical protein
MTTTARACAITVYLVARTAAPADDAPGPHAPQVRGMTVSCQSWGREWGTDEMVQAMRELRDLGVNWISIHPYAAIRADGTVSVSGRWYGDAGWLTRPIGEAHGLGLKIMITPHLAQWGSPFSQRGDIEFADDEEWARFFSSYEAWIAGLAELCAGADGFCVGSELDRTVAHEAQWRRIVSSVRSRLPGVALTYAANWPQYSSVPFWDVLDAIGVQAYFPLAEQPGPPDPEALAAAWRRHLDRLEAFASRARRKVVFTELGYSRSPRAAVEPWDGREGGGDDAEETQRRCLDAALRALERSDTVVGAFLWKWFPGQPHRHENFLMSAPAMRAVIARHWTEPGDLPR